MVEVTEDEELVADRPDGDGTESPKSQGLKELLQQQMEAAKAEELVRVDSTHIHNFVGGALNLIVDQLGDLEKRCGRLEKDVAAQALCRSSRSSSRRSTRPWSASSASRTAPSSSSPR
jgi:hypothetical protein